MGKASLRVVKPARGSVWFDGQDITALGEEEIKPFRRRAQAVFQDPYSSINSFMNVAQIVEEPLVIHDAGGKSEREDRVREALTSVGLTRPSRPFISKFPTYPLLRPSGSGSGSLGRRVSWQARTTSWPTSRSR